jgi:hypothetical protein
LLRLNAWKGSLVRQTTHDGNHHPAVEYILALSTSTTNGAMAVKVFISYRRDDSRYQARDIHKAFCQVIPRDHVFMDVDTIPPGADFRKVLQGWVKQCEVLLALIGPEWINASDPKTNRRRLDNPSDEGTRRAAA